MPKNSSKGFNVSIDPANVMYTNISTSKDGYNSANVIVKVGEKEYLRVSCEWEGDNIPGFAMDLMAFMKSNKMEKSGVWTGKEEAYAEFSAKKAKKEDKKVDKKVDKNKDEEEEMCPDCKKPMPECVCDEE